MSQEQKLRNQVEKQALRMKKAQKEQDTLLSQTIYIGTLGLLMVIPVIGGAYLGMWLDNLRAGYSFFWTLVLLLAGLVIGVTNVYFFIRE